MPPLASSLMIGVGSVVAVCGLVLLLTALTLNPRAKRTLIVCDREWRLRTLAILGLLAGGLCLGLPWVHTPAGPLNAPSHTTDRLRSHDNDRHVLPARDHAHQSSHDQENVVTGESVETEQPAPRQLGESEGAPPDEPVNLTGEWRITNTIVETSYPPYRRLRLGFRLAVRHEGSAFTGDGEKTLENGRPIPVAARRPIRIQGRVRDGSVRDGSVVEATFQEDGRSRRVEGHFRLTLQDRRQLTGTFVSTAADARGASQWIRDSTPRREPPSREGHPDPTPMQDTPPVIALVVPVQGQQVTTAQMQVNGTVTGARGMARVDILVNGERQVQRTVLGQTTVDVSEPLTLRHGPNEIVVTAVDQQHRSASQRVMVTRLEESAGASAPAEEPRNRVPAAHRAAQQSGARLQLGMSQAEVRALLGEPVNIEETLSFVFWHYGTEAYVVFDERTGRVHGWLGVSS